MCFLKRCSYRFISYDLSLDLRVRQILDKYKIFTHLKTAYCTNIYFVKYLTTYLKFTNFIYLFIQMGLYLSKFKSYIVRSISVSFWANRLKSSVMTLKYTEIKNYIHLKVTKVKDHDLSWPCILCTKSILWTNNDEVLTVCISAPFLVNLVRWFRLNLVLIFWHYFSWTNFILASYVCLYTCPFNVSLTRIENRSRYIYSENWSIYV